MFFNKLKQKVQIKSFQKKVFFEVRIISKKILSLKMKSIIQMIKSKKNNSN